MNSYGAYEAMNSVTKEHWRTKGGRLNRCKLKHTISIARHLQSQYSVMNTETQRRLHFQKCKQLIQTIKPRK